MFRKNHIIIVLGLLSLGMFSACSLQDLSDNEPPKLEVVQPFANNTLFVDEMDSIKLKMSDNDKLSSYAIEIYHPEDNNKPQDNADSAYFHYVAVNGSFFGHAQKDTIVKQDVYVNPIRILSITNGEKTENKECDIKRGAYQMRISVSDYLGNETSQKFEILIKSKPEEEGKKE